MNKILLVLLSLHSLTNADLHAANSDASKPAGEIKKTEELSPAEIGKLVKDRYEERNTLDAAVAAIEEFDRKSREQQNTTKNSVAASPQKHDSGLRPTGPDDKVQDSGPDFSNDDDQHVLEIKRTKELSSKEIGDLVRKRYEERNPIEKFSPATRGFVSKRREQQNATRNSVAASPQEQYSDFSSATPNDNVHDSGANFSNDEDQHTLEREKTKKLSSAERRALAWDHIEALNAAAVTFSTETWF